MQEQVVIPVGVGLVSGGAQLFQDNIKASGVQRNVVLRNAGALADYALAAYGLVNHLGDMGYPRRGSSELLASAVTLGVRRVTQQLGDVVLGLQRPIVKSVARVRETARMRVGQPAEVLEMGVGEERVIVNRT